MCKIGKGHNTAAPYPRGLAQHHFGIAQMLQGIDLQHHVEGIIFEHSQSLVEIELNNVYPALHAGQYIGIGNFHTVTGAIALALQVVEHGAIAAAQIQHPGTAWYQLGYGFLKTEIGHAISPAIWAK